MCTSIYIGAEALDRVKEAYNTGDRYDVVLCDIQVRRRVYVNSDVFFTQKYA